jgi:hypothetical protein
MLSQETGSTIIGAVQLLFALVLLPSLFNSRTQVPRTSSSLTALGLFIIGVVYTMLGLRDAAVCGFIGAFVWLLLFFIRPVRRNP